MNFHFKRLDDSQIASYDTVAMREKRIALLLDEARIAKSATESYWKRMRSYYDGTHETAKQTGEFLASLDLSWQPASVPDGYLHVESQIDAKPPDFEFSGRGDADESVAEMRERVVRYVLQNNDLISKNAINERRLNLYGSAVWKLSVGRDEKGEKQILVENPPPETIFPDPCATDPNECEYIACVYRMSRDRAARIFALDLERMGTDIGSVMRNGRSPSNFREEISPGETVEITEWWFRQPYDGEALVSICTDRGIEHIPYTWHAGDIALSILIEGTEIRYVPKFWTKTSCRNFPFILYKKIPKDGSIWGKSELEAIIPLIDAADRQLLFAQLNTAFFANDILLYEENAFAPDSYPENRPGAIWKLRPGMMEKVKRLGGLAGESAAHYEIADKYRAMMKEAVGNYDFMQGDSATRVTTATGLALLGDYASRRTEAKNICKKAGFEHLYRMIDYMALECFSPEKISAITDGKTPCSYDEYLAEYGYVPALDVCVHVGGGVENSPSFTLSALSELCNQRIDADNYPVVRAYINALGIPERASLLASLDAKFDQKEENQDEKRE